MQRLHLDFETYCELDIRKVGHYRYCEHESFRILCVAWALDNTMPKVAEAYDIPYRDVRHLVADPNIELAAHNASFERQCLKSQHGVEMFGEIDWSKKKVICTAAKAAARALPRDLDRASKVLGLVRKDETGKRSMMKFCKPDKNGVRLMPDDNPEEWEAVLEYCRQDVLVEQAIDRALPDLHPDEQKLYELDDQINSYGCYADRQVMDSVLSMGPLVKKKNADDCFDLIGFKPTQVGKILEWINAQGVEVEDTTAATLKALLLRDDVPDLVKTVIKHRQIASKTSVAKYDTARGAICDDDRLRGMFLFHGAGTGRWTGKLVQLHNLPRGNVKDTDSACDMLADCDDLDLISSLYPDVMGLFSSCIRGIMKAPPGKQFYVADYAGIEARVLGWMAGEENYQKAFRASSDLYKVQAAGIYGVDYDSVTGEQRQLGKAAVLGLGYQMGLKTFATTCENWGIKVDEQVLAKAHAGYRRSNAKIVEMWGALDRAATATVMTGKMHTTHMVTYGMTRDGKFLLCRLPSGRFLSYPFPKIVDGTFGGKQVSACAIKEGQWVRRSLYGGLYCENVIQAVARDLLRDGMQAVQDDGRWDIVGTVHDEIIAEGVPGHDIKDFENLMANQPLWSEGCIYEAEGWEGPRFKKG